MCSFWISIGMRNCITDLGLLFISLILLFAVKCSILNYVFDGLSMGFAWFVYR